MNSRAFATRILRTVIIEKHSLSESLAPSLSELKDPRDKAFVQSLCYGVCRWYYKLDDILSKLLAKPLKHKDSDLHILLLVGLYQLIYMRVLPHAAVTETVNATKALQKIWAKGLVNAVLRNFLRKTSSVQQDEQNNIEAEFSHPSWLIQKLQNHYPNQWQAILSANNQHPPFSLRVNQQRLSREDYCAKLNELNIAMTIIPETEAGIILENPIDVKQVPGFLIGDISVQDGGAQLAAQLLELIPNCKVLDACAAPGGKTAHILEREPSANCTAIDRDPARLERIKENLERLGLCAHVIAVDAADLATWWSGDLFDRILLDAPCSATGVIRRHPDIKLLRQESDIHALAEEQLRLLTSLWQVLKKDGVLVYCTCSVLPDENSQVIERFLTLHPDAKLDQIPLMIGVDDGFGKQILPGIANMDGFYYARLRK